MGAVEGVESMEGSNSVARKRRRISEEHMAQSEDTVTSVVEVSACPSAASNSCLEIQALVHVVNLNNLKPIYDMEQDKEPAIRLPTWSMPTYTGAGCTLTYLYAQQLQKAGKNNQKITAYFKPET